MILYLAALLLSSFVVSLTFTFGSSIQHYGSVFTENKLFNSLIFQPHPPAPLLLESEAAHKASLSKTLY